MFRDNKVSPRGGSDADSPRKVNRSSSANDREAFGGSGVNIQSEAEEVSLLSKLDNKHIKSEFTNSSSFFGACFCPCLYLGHLDSKVKREESLCTCCSESCPRYSFGKGGCLTCCLTGMFCSLGWPCSPCLTCYLNTRSANISTIYDNNLDRNWCRDFNFLWPKTVLQHILLYEQLEREGRLFYDWTLSSDVLSTQKICGRFGMQESAVLIVGANGVGKTELLMKLCHRNLYEKREVSFENNEVRVGFRPMTVTNTHVTSLEFWDIPTLHLQSIHTIRAKISYILLVFNVNDFDSFKELKKIYKEVKEMAAVNESNVEYILVAAQNDHLHYSKTPEGRWEMDPNYDTIAMASSWAGDNNIQVVSTATPFNIGVNELLKIAQSPPNKDQNDEKGQTERHEE
mmetsp:Transcript_19800/g.33299  ORF Transcript_19800/g.33299 Transcript_19800/m.33299 type:complete len:400 (-) Transcript_19800:140-1339(-)